MATSSNKKKKQIKKKVATRQVTRQEQKTVSSSIWQRIVRWLRVDFGWLFGVAILYLSPFFIFPAFNVIDDGASLLVARRLIADVSLQNWSNLLVETQVGRLRPLYHLSFLLIYLIGGLNPFWYWLAQALILGATLWIAAKILFELTHSKYLSALLPLSLLFVTPTADNFYRLGTAEAKQTLLMLIFLWWLVIIEKTGWTGKKLGVAALILAASLLMKETSVTFIIPVVLLVLWQILQRKISFSQVMLTSLLGFLTLGYLFLIPSSGSYSSNFHLSWHDMYARLLSARLEHAILFFPFFISVVATIVRAAVQIRNKTVNARNIFWQLILLSQFLFMLFIGILPWQFQLGRYFYPLYALGILYIGNEAVAWVPVLKKWSELPKWRQLFWSSLAVFAAVVLQITVFQSGRVLSLSSSLMKDRLFVFRLSYAPMLLILCLGLAITLIRVVYTFLSEQLSKENVLDSFMWQLWGIVTFIWVVLFSVLVWQLQWPRMFYMVNVVIMLYWISELRQWQTLSLPLPRKAWVGVGGVLVVLAFILNHFVFLGKSFDVTPFVGAVVQNNSMAFDTHQVSYGVISYLLDKTPDHANVYVSSGDYEVIFELGLYASKLNQRDVKIFTNNQQLITDVGKDFPYLQYTSDPVMAFVSGTEPKLLLLRQKDWQVLLDKGVDLTDPLHPVQTKTDWHQFSAEDRKPALSFHTLPDGAEWVVVK